MDEQCGTPTLSGLRQPPVLQRLKKQREDLQQRLDNIDDAINKLEANPAVSQILESLNRLGHY